MFKPTTRNRAARLALLLAAVATVGTGCRGCLRENVVYEHMFNRPDPRVGPVPMPRNWHPGGDLSLTGCLPAMRCRGGNCAQCPGDNPCPHLIPEFEPAPGGPYLPGAGLSGPRQKDDPMPAGRYVPPPQPRRTAPAGPYQVAD